MLGDPICVRTLSSHCRGPLRCSSIQQGVLVTVWRLQGTEEEVLQNKDYLVFGKSSQPSSFSQKKKTNLWANLSPLSQLLETIQDFSQRCFLSGVFGARNMTRSTHSPVGIPLQWVSKWVHPLLHVLHSTACLLHSSHYSALSCLLTTTPPPTSINRTTSFLFSLRLDSINSITGIYAIFIFCYFKHTDTKNKYMKKYKNYDFQLPGWFLLDYPAIKKLIHSTNIFSDHRTMNSPSGQEWPFFSFL